MGGGDQETGQSGMNRESEHLTAERRDPSRVITGPEPGQKVFGRTETFFRRGIEPAKAAGIGLTPGMEDEGGPAKVDPMDFGEVRLGQAAMFALGPESQAASRGRPARPARPLRRRGAADPSQLEPVQ